MKLTWGRAEYWFNIDYDTMTFENKQVAKTKNQAWEKTIIKWMLIEDWDYDDVSYYDSYSCGWCDISENCDNNTCDISDPLRAYATERKCCSASKNKFEVMWLLGVREFLNA